jgi:hypothetical protein
MALRARALSAAAQPTRVLSMNSSTRRGPAARGSKGAGGQLARDTVRFKCGAYTAARSASAAPADAGMTSYRAGVRAVAWGDSGRRLLCCEVEAKKGCCAAPRSLPQLVMGSRSSWGPGGVLWWPECACALHAGQLGNHALGYRAQRCSRRSAGSSATLIHTWGAACQARKLHADGSGHLTLTSHPPPKCSAIWVCVERHSHHPRGRGFTVEVERTASARARLCVHWLASM